MDFEFLTQIIGPFNAAVVCVHQKTALSSFKGAANRMLVQCLSEKGDVSFFVVDLSMKHTRLFKKITVPHGEVIVDHLIH